MLPENSHGLEMLLDQLDCVIQTPADVEKLEQTILQLAVQGKLVPHNPNDKPASILLGRIEAEKARLVKEGKIRKGKKLRPVSTDDVPHELPCKWSWARLGDCIELISGQHIKRSNYNEEGVGIPYLTGPSDFGEVHPAIGKWAPKPKVLARRDDILLTVKGSGLGKVNIVDIEQVAISRQLMAVRPILTHMQYVYLFLKSRYSYFQNSGIGIAIPGISRDDVNNIMFPLPPLEEQRRIVAKVDELFAQTRRLKAQLAQTAESRTTLQKAAVRRLASAETPAQRSDAWHLIAGHFHTLYDAPAHVDDLKQAILQLAVQGKLVPQNPGEEPASVLLERIAADKKRLVRDGKIRKERGISPISGEELPLGLPDGWEWAKLGKLAQVVEYGTSRKADAGREVGVPVLRMNNIDDGQVVLDQLKYVPPDIKDLPRLYLKHNDLLFNRTNSYELVGKTGVFKGADDIFTLASYLIRVTLFTDYVDPDYVNAYLNSPVCRVTQIEPEITQQTNQANFNGTKLKNIVVPVPPCGEQKRIMAKVNELLALCGRLTEQVTAAHTIRERLLEALLAGAT